MKITYIKDAPNGPAGSSDEVTEFEGNVLVLTGFAEVDEPKPKTKPKAKATTKTDSE